MNLAKNSVLGKRTVILGIILLLGVVSLVFQSYWLPKILLYIPWLEKNSDIIQSLEAIISIILVLFNILTASVFWSTGSSLIANNTTSASIIKRVTGEHLRNLLGSGGSITWIDRDAVHPKDLRAYRRIVISGPSRIGKTREAVELIRRAVEQEFFFEDSLISVSDNFPFVRIDEIEGMVWQFVDRDANTLLFVDNFAAKY